MHDVNPLDIVETIREGVLVVEPDLTIRFANRSFYDTFAVAPEHTVGLKLYEIGNGQWDIPKLRTTLETIISGQKTIEAFEVESTNMYMSGKSLMIILFVGLTAGWVAGQMLQGVGFGIISDLLIGIVGAFIGSWLLPQFGIHLGLGIVAAIINATIGALVLLLIIRLVRGGWQASWGKRS
jgi:uncharacterized membrane protein YeaQ/YmgE (transglycosylase-associated protein family)